MRSILRLIPNLNEWTSSRLGITTLLTVAVANTAVAANSFVVQQIETSDEKPVFATVESLNIIPARIRTGGTVVAVSVCEGDMVKAGQAIALTADRRLAQQINALDAQIDSMKAQAAQAQAELERNRPLFDNGVVSHTQMDALRTAATVAASGLKARIAERAALGEQIAQGEVVSPAAGRVLTVPTAVGAVMMPGEVVATIARQDMIVRIQVPERNAASLHQGQNIRIDGDGMPNQGTVGLIYPHVVQGLVQADIKVSNTGGYFVGQRLRAWIPGEKRQATVVPTSYLIQRFGMDYARLHQPDGQDLDVSVQRGGPVPMGNGSEGIEILSGLQSGDMLVQP